MLTDERVQCSRCRRMVDGARSEVATAGFYDAAGWAKYADPGEEIICDECMFADSRYLADYPAQGYKPMSGIFRSHFARFREKFPDAVYHPRKISQAHMAVVEYTFLKMPPMWNRPQVKMLFAVAANYPWQRPYGFWTDADLGLVDGSGLHESWMAVAARDEYDYSAEPTGRLLRFFRWTTMAAWNPGRCDLVTFARFYATRFNEAAPTDAR